MNNNENKQIVTVRTPAQHRDDFISNYREEKDNFLQISSSQKGGSERLQQIEDQSMALRLGILGGGQLGQMMTTAAKKKGHRVVVYDVLPEGPAASVADEMIVAPLDDERALRNFANRVDIITLEFENIPIASLEFLSTLRPLHPSAQVVRICQNRILEKQFLQSHQIPIAPFHIITSAEELGVALNELAAPSLLKTAMLGYDGKGQVPLTRASDARTVWASFGAKRAVLEQRIDFHAEGSIIVARSTQGEISCFPPQENRHVRGILDVSRAPARFPQKVLYEVESLGRRIAEAIGVIGLLTVEFFVLPNNEIIVNELAPRPHNSGHHTIESSKSSQFEQAVRAVTEAQLGSSELVQPAIMLNLLGDLWQSGEPDWQRLLEVDRAHSFLHLYGKKEARPGRKMGHITFTGERREELLQQAKESLRLRKD